MAAFYKVRPENRVFAGTINGSGAIEVMVARRADRPTMARVVNMVTQAEARRSPTQHFTERFERIFVSAVAGLVALLLRRIGSGNLAMTTHSKTCTGAPKLLARMAGMCRRPRAGLTWTSNAL